MSTRKLIGIGAAVAIALTVSPLARADAFAKPESRVVRYSETELNSPTGVKTVYWRILEAARAVCGPSEAPGRAFPSTAWANCVNKSVGIAVAQVDRPALTAYYAQRTGRRPAPTLAARTD